MFTADHRELEKRERLTKPKREGHETKAASLDLNYRIRLSQLKSHKRVSRVAFPVMGLILNTHPQDTTSVKSISSQSTKSTREGGGDDGTHPSACRHNCTR